MMAWPVFVIKSAKKRKLNMNFSLIYRQKIFVSSSAPEELPKSGDALGNKAYQQHRIPWHFLFLMLHISYSVNTNNVIFHLPLHFGYWFSVLFIFFSVLQILSVLVQCQTLGCDQQDTFVYQHNVHLLQKVIIVMPLFLMVVFVIFISNVYFHFSLRPFVCCSL